MRRDPRAYLADIVDASRLVAGFIAGHTLDRYRSDVLLRSAVERQLEIVGEALNRLSRTDPVLASRISHARTIIGFRNVLAHGYDVVRDETVWEAITHELPVLASEASALLSELESS
jgi:uncharacterized protein with HEPN domain